MVVVLLTVWVLGGLLVAFVVGRVVRTADHRDDELDDPAVLEVETPAAA